MEHQCDITLQQSWRLYRKMKMESPIIVINTYTVYTFIYTVYTVYKYTQMSLKFMIYYAI